MDTSLQQIVRRLALCAVAGAALAGCAPAWLSPLEREHPLAGRILDARTGRYASRHDLLQRAAGARFVILGETHDNPDHHRLQAEVLAAMLRAGRAPALAMEQFDREHQAALDQALQRGERDPERIADAGRFNRKGWGWPFYRPLVALAAVNRLPVLAANLSREDARALMRSGRSADGLGPAPAPLRAALERDIVEGHCGRRPPETVLSGMIEAQRGRDALMASVMERAGNAGAVLIAGLGHARRDRGTPVHLSDEARGRLLVIAFIEVESGAADPVSYVRGDAAGSFDLVWFTPRAAREDPCANPVLR